MSCLAPEVELSAVLDQVSCYLWLYTRKKLVYYIGISMPSKEWTPNLIQD